jgi:hypothetical protein
MKKAEERRKKTLPRNFPGPEENSGAFPFGEGTVLKVAHAYEVHPPWKERRPVLE